MNRAELEALITQIVQKLLPQEQTSYDVQIQRIKQKLAQPYDTTAPSFLGIIKNLAQQVPDEEWAKVPRDASMRYKEYLYGEAWNQE